MFGALLRKLWSHGIRINENLAEHQPPPGFFFAVVSDLSTILYTNGRREVIAVCERCEWARLERSSSSSHNIVFNVSRVWVDPNGQHPVYLSWLHEMSFWAASCQANFLATIASIVWANNCLNMTRLPARRLEFIKSFIQFDFWRIPCPTGKYYIFLKACCTDQKCSFWWRTLFPPTSLLNLGLGPHTHCCHAWPVSFSGSSSSFVTQGGGEEGRGHCWDLLPCLTALRKQASEYSSRFRWLQSTTKWIRVLLVREPTSSWWM